MKAGGIGCGLGGRGKGDGRGLHGDVSKTSRVIHEEEGCAGKGMRACERGGRRRRTSDGAADINIKRRMERAV